MRVLPLALLLSAAPMLVGSLYAMAEILWEAGLPPWALPWGQRREGDERDAPYTREALTLTTWGLYLLVVVYLVLLFGNQI